jgi:hypothetical protein
VRPRARTGDAERAEAGPSRSVAPRPGAVDLGEVPLAPAPGTNGHAAAPEPAPAGRAPEPPPVRRPPELERIPDAPGVAAPRPTRPAASDERDAPADPTDARRARAAERSAPTVQFRSGSAVPVRRSDANGAARPAARRRRQLRAR